jgi:hypothetical protein
MVLVVTGALCIAATAPVAMRVEVQPLRQVGPLTEVEVIIQIAPMDRGRMGSNAIVRLELDEGRVSSGSPMRAAAIENDGSIRVLVEWPPGEHDLRVFVEDPSKEDTGLWVGTVRIPEFGRAPTDEHVVEPTPVPDLSRRSPEAKPDPVPVPVPVPVPDAVQGAVPDQTSETAQDPESESTSLPEPMPADEPTVAAPAAAGAAIAAESQLPPTPSDVEVPKSESPAEVSVPEPVAVEVEETPTEIETIPENEPIDEIAAAPEPDPEPIAAPIEEETISAIEEPTIDEIETIGTASQPELEVMEVEPQSLEVEEPQVTEAPPLVEPLRADPPAESTIPEATAVEPVPEALAMSSDQASLYQDWTRADSETNEFSVIMLRGREPARNVEASDVRVRIGGSDTPIERLGGVENAPLLLGLAVDVSPEEIEAWSGMQGSLAPIIDRAKAGRGRLFISNQRAVGDWDAGYEASAQMGGRTVAMNIAELVAASLERFEGQRGRTFLVVLTDGRSEPTKDEWQRATDIAGVSGVPILVISLWDEKFSQRTRKNLKKLTVASGGSLFLVQGREQLESAADRFGRYLDGGYSIRYQVPAGTGDAALPVTVSTDDRTIEVIAPKSVR